MHLFVTAPKEHRGADPPHRPRVPVSRVEVTGGSLSRRQPISDIPCHSASHRRRDPMFSRFPSPMAAGAHPQPKLEWRSGRPASPGAGASVPCYRSRWPDAPECLPSCSVSEELALPDGPRASPALVVLEVPMPRSPWVIGLRSRQRDRRPCPWLGSPVARVLAEPVAGNPETRRTDVLQPTSSVFKTEHPRLVQLPEVAWEDEPPAPRWDDHWITVGHPALAGQHRYFAIRGILLRVRPVRPSL